MRRYPRSSLTRGDSLLSGAHVSQHGPRNDRSRRDWLARHDGQCTGVATGTARPCNESDVAGGGMILVFALTGNDRFHADIITARFPTLVLGLSVTSTAPIRAISDVLSGSMFALATGGKTLTLTLPAVAAYSVNVNQSYSWTFDDSLFRNRAQPLTVSSAINVVANA